MSIVFCVIFAYRIHATIGEIIIRKEIKNDKNDNKYRRGRAHKTKKQYQSLKICGTTTNMPSRAVYFKEEINKEFLSKRYERMAFISEFLTQHLSGAGRVCKKFHSWQRNLLGCLS
ncbi:hypothetical protein J2TS6_57460 [Paenibacillus albilobatus]|uniref:Uncharacterized protein n=1 Tax=Paenibacillus albilobatus TaxID=2716884 RepID=A0A919XPM0_9BACL|nr:hypothetical protein [Paenibacillus albilobatus]GIO34605.1 hypothetical protein J2TS6_57460 [Paenibacillus albilobatus]